MNDPTFQRLLQSVLFDNMYDRYVGHRKTGKLNAKTLSKISFSDKLFKKKEERLNKNYSIALLVDCSGSMRGRKARFAFEAAKKLSRHLSSARVPHAVYGFNVPTVQLKPFNTAFDTKTDRKLELMLDDLCAYWDKNGEYLGHDIDFKNLKCGDVPGEKGEYEHRARGAIYNNDCYAVRTVANDLSKQKGTKIMIVLSDGSPAYIGSDYLKVPGFPKEFFLDESYDEKGTRQDLSKDVHDALKRGIEVHSIGIQTDKVNRYYPSDRTCAIYDLGQLYDHIIKIIKLNLKRG